MEALGGVLFLMSEVPLYISTPILNSHRANYDAKL